MSKRHYEDWMNRKWRPATAWSYLVINIFDFIIFPIAFTTVQVYQGIPVTTAWEPITLYGAGLFHLAMGAILGVTAWSRGQEKIHHVNNDNSDYYMENEEHRHTRKRNLKKPSRIHDPEI